MKSFLRWCGEPATNARVILWIMALLLGSLSARCQFKFDSTGDNPYWMKIDKYRFVPTRSQTFQFTNSPDSIFVIIDKDTLRSYKDNYMRMIVRNEAVKQMKYYFKVYK